MKLPRAVVIQMGYRRHYAVPAALQKFHMLKHFYTGIYAGNGSWLNKVTQIIPDTFKTKCVKRVIGRREDSLPGNKVTAFNMLEMYNYLRKAKAKNIDEIFLIDIQLAKKMAHRLRIKNALKEADIIYAFTMESAEIFEYAKAIGVICVLDQVHPSFRVVLEIVKKEFELWEGWENTDIVSYDKFTPLLEREMKEFALADLIIATSQFTADGLASIGLKKDKCKVIYNGINILNDNIVLPRRKKDCPINLLFVGRVDLRKGVPYLLEALKRLPMGLANTRIVGPIAIYKEKLDIYGKYCEIVGPVPRTELTKIYKWADIFVFPTVLEGSATVVFEALAHGLPVITTPNAGSVVRDGVDGFIVPIRDVKVLTEKIELLATDHELRQWMSQNARKRAEEYNLPNYGRRLSEVLMKLYNQT